MNTDKLRHMKTSKALEQAAMERSKKFMGFAKAIGYPFGEEGFDATVRTMARLVFCEFINGAEWQQKQQREKKKKASNK